VHLTKAALVRFLRPLFVARHQSGAWRARSSIAKVTCDAEEEKNSHQTGHPDCRVVPEPDQEGVERIFQAAPRWLPRRTAPTQTGVTVGIHEHGPVAGVCKTIRIQKAQPPTRAAIAIWTAAVKIRLVLIDDVVGAVGVVVHWNLGEGNAAALVAALAGVALSTVLEETVWKGRAAKDSRAWSRRAANHTI
jgi:hypothetical protein